VAAAAGAGAMTDDEIRELTAAISSEVQPLHEVLQGLLTILEQLTTRVERLELEVLHQAPSPET
jgi:hypothetical protein